MSDFIPEVPQGLEGEAPPDAEEYVPNDTPVAGEDNQQDTGDKDESKTGINPSWNAALENIPQEFHQFLTPKFKEWDSNFEKVQSQLSPYKPLIENNVPFEMVQQSLQLAQALNADPRAVYDELERRYGFSGQGQQEADEDNNDDEEEDNEYDPENEGKYDPLKDPRMQPFFEQQRQQNEYLQQRQQEEFDRQVAQEMEQTWQSLSKTHGKPLDESEKEEVLKRALFIADKESARTGREVEPDLEVGYKDYVQFVNRIRGQRANNTAPDVLGGSGGLPAAPRGLREAKTDEERQDYIAEQLRLLNQSNQ